MKLMLLALIAVAGLAFGAGSLVTPPPVTSSRSQLPVAEASRDSADEQDVDAYGNEVSDAVAEYSLDPTGALYEVHAPQVEIPKLGSPKS